MTYKITKIIAVILLSSQLCSANGPYEKAGAETRILALEAQVALNMLQLAYERAFHNVGRALEYGSYWAIHQRVQNIEILADSENNEDQLQAIEDILSVFPDANQEDRGKLLMLLVSLMKEAKNQSVLYNAVKALIITLTSDGMTEGERSEPLRALINIAWESYPPLELATTIKIFKEVFENGQLSLGERSDQLRALINIAWNSYPLLELVTIEIFKEVFENGQPSPSERNAILTVLLHLAQVDSPITCLCAIRTLTELSKHMTEDERARGLPVMDKMAFLP